MFLLIFASFKRNPRVRHLWCKKFTNDDDGDQEEPTTDTTIPWYTCFSSYLLCSKRKSHVHQWWRWWPGRGRHRYHDIMIHMFLFIFASSKRNSHVHQWWRWWPGRGRHRYPPPPWQAGSPLGPDLRRISKYCQEVIQEVIIILSSRTRSEEKQDPIIGWILALILEIVVLVV